MITLLYISELYYNTRIFGLEEWLKLIIVVPFTLMLDFTIGLVIFTILLNIIRFTISFI